MKVVLKLSGDPMSEVLGELDCWRDGRNLAPIPIKGDMLVYEWTSYEVKERNMLIADDTIELWVEPQ